jgi:hypothetical protein
LATLSREYRLCAFGRIRWQPLGFHGVGKDAQQHTVGPQHSGGTGTLSAYAADPRLDAEHDPVWFRAD